VLTTVSSADKAQLAGAAGADHIINYTEVDVAAEVRRIAPHGIDTIVEVAPAQNAAIDAEEVAPNGAIAVYANNGGDEFTLPVRPSMVTNARWQFVLLYTAPSAAKGRAIEDVVAGVLDGAIRVGSEAGLPLTHFPLEKTADAHAAVEAGAVGKVLIDLAG
jgi:NADPH2:quinone reductase